MATTFGPAAPVTTMEAVGAGSTYADSGASGGKLVCSVKAVYGANREPVKSAIGD